MQRLKGYSIGGKTATSQTLPRSANRYISSFLGLCTGRRSAVFWDFALFTIPRGMYYGGTIAAPVIRRIFENVLPYLGNLE